MIKQEDLKFGTVALSVAPLLQRTFVHKFTPLLLQTQVLQHERGEVNQVISEEVKNTRTTCSPCLKISCESSCNKLNLFSALPVSSLTALRNARTSSTAFGSVTLSGLSSEVCLRTASSRRGYLASRVVGFVR